MTLANVTPTQTIFADEGRADTVIRIHTALQSLDPLNPIFADEDTAIEVLVEYMSRRCDSAGLLRTMSAMHPSYLILASAYALTGFLCTSGKVAIVSGTFDTAAGAFASLLFAPVVS